VIILTVTLNLMIMSIVGKLYGFKVITLTFLHLACNSVCIWFEQSRSFSKFEPDNTTKYAVLSLSVSSSKSGGSVSVLETQTSVYSHSLRLRKPESLMST